MFVDGERTPMVVLLINNLVSLRGGADAVCINTGQLLEAEGQRVVYFSQKGDSGLRLNGSEYFIKPIEYFSKSFVKRIKSFPRFFYSREAAENLKRLINDYHPDIAHVHLYKGGITPSILRVLKRNNIPVLLSLHDYGLLCPHNLFLDGKMEICDRCLYGNCFNVIVKKCNRNSIFYSSISFLEYMYERIFYPFDRYFDGLIAVSRFCAAKHEESRKFNFKRIYQLYNFSPNLDKAKVTSRKGDYMVYLGRLSKEKGISILLAAWKAARIEGCLKIIGTGEMKAELELNRIDGVEILGFKTGDELQQLVSESSFLIVPSEWYENNPMVIIEAYSYGKPVIASEIGGIPEIVVEGETGFLFKPGDVDDLVHKLITAVSINQDTYSRMSKSAREFVEANCDPSTYYNQLMAIYNDVIGAK